MELYNKQAEKEIIGIMLSDNKKIQLIKSKINKEDFFIYNNIFENICNTYDQYKSADLTNVKNVNLEELINCIESVVTVEHWKDRCKKIKLDSVKRKYVINSKKIEKIILKDPHVNLLELKEKIISLFDMSIDSNNNSAYQIKNIIPHTISEIKKNSEQKELKYPFGLIDIDDLTLGLHDNELTCIAATPGTGKTTFAIQTLLNLANKNYKVLMYNLEMSKFQVCQKIISNITGINSYKLRTGKLLKNEWDEINKTENIKNKNISIIDDVKNIEEIVIKSKEMRLNNNVDVIFVDYLQLILTKEKLATESNRIGHISRQLKLLGKDLGIPIVVLSQLSRASVKDKRRPNMSDLRGSGDIEADCDNIYFLYNPLEIQKDTEVKKMYDIEFLIEKQRYGQAKVFKEIGFLPYCSKFVNLQKNIVYNKSFEKAIEKNEKETEEDFFDNL